MSTYAPAIGRLLTGNTDIAYTARPVITDAVIAIRALASKDAFKDIFTKYNIYVLKAAIIQTAGPGAGSRRTHVDEQKQPRDSDK